MKIRTVAVLGAGAVGAYVIQGLYDKLGDGLMVIASGSRKERLLKEGLTINGRTYALNVREPEEVRGVDLIIVCLKYGALVPALPDIEKAADGHCLVMSLMNGVDSEEIIGGRIGMDRVVHSVIKIASRRIGSDIRFELPYGPMGISLGEPGIPAGASEKTAAILEVLSGTNLCVHGSDHILEDIWEKFALNVSRNIPQAILGVGVGCYSDSPNCAALADRLEDEVYAVAAARGIYPDRGRKLAGQDKRARYSTLQDLDAGRPTEVDMFCGAMVRMGQALGVPTPFCACTGLLIRALEEKNRGLFDYPEP